LAAYHRADYLLFDSAQAGSGTRFDWGQLPALDGSGLVQPSFLAGGIGCDTIAAALELKPFAVDISSGAETDGLKDRSKMHYLVQQVRSHERSI
jgi:phosphoribosylanthranilate isomerase